MAFCTAAALDALIASSLCCLLATSCTEFPRIDSFITKLIHYTIDTGCLTSICSIAVIITYTLIPYSFIFLGVEFIVAKLYVNSYIALLNARYYTQSNAATINSPDSSSLSIGLCKASQDETLLAYRRSLVDKHVEQPPQILVTVVKESFVDQ
ncbi:uncharacterized protein EDB91DRAFT_888586 [Suillus paluster]|uniref:uncharacterized protein n=1 Tax=Suillus paluster TaxID=48578 RepID=UPI001B85F4FD|nr:uncharacterized protein EDB91DRAFT_888586 [Suillus paluster]KAG1727668.1 hypothetical protein EDB91DRAFT_888586 [Suillus paluster]